MTQKLSYFGEVFTDMTAFSRIGKLLEGDSKISSNAILDTEISNFESILELLFFYEKILILKPSTYGMEMKIEENKFMKKCINFEYVAMEPNNFCNNVNDFLSHSKAITDILDLSGGVNKFCQNNKNYQDDLSTYDDLFDLSNNQQIKQMANKIRWPLDSISLGINLLRTKNYFDFVGEKRSKNRIVPYYPNFLRKDLVKKFMDNEERYILDQIHKLTDSIAKSKSDDVERFQKEFPFRKYKFDLPILSSYVLGQCKTKDDIFEEIKKIRNGSDARHFRKWFIEYHNAIYNDNIEFLKDSECRIDELARDLAGESYHSPNNVISATIEKRMGSYDYSMMTHIAEAAIDNVDIDVVHPEKSLGKLVKTVTTIPKGDLIIFSDIKKKIINLNNPKDKFKTLFNIK